MAGEPSKVLFCTFTVLPEPSGLCVRFTEHLRALAGAYEVDALTVKTADLSHIERFLGARLMRVPVGAADLPERTGAFERAVRRQLESDEYRLVHFTDPFGGYALCELKAKHGYKTVYEVTGLPSVEVRYTHPHLESDRRFMAKLRRQELFCLMNADAVVTGSEVTAGLIQAMGVPRERIAVVPTPPPDVPPAPLPQTEGSPMRVLYLGSQHSWQGLPTLVFATAMASASCDLRVSIVGPQTPRWHLQLEEMIRGGGMAERVRLCEPVGPDALPALLAQADVGVAPLERGDRNEHQGAPIGKVAAYLAAGRPVIAADLPLVREVTRDDCTLYHRPGDERSLAEKLVELARAPQLRVRMGRCASAFAQERLAAERARAKLLGVYRGLIGTGRTASSPENERAAADAPTSIKAAAAHDTHPHVPTPDEPTQTQRVPAPEAPARSRSYATTDPSLPVPGGPPAEKPRATTDPDLPAPAAPPGPPLEGAGPGTPSEDWLGHVLFGYAPFDPSQPR